MDRATYRIDTSNHRLRRVGRLTRRRMRLEGADLANGIHTDGRLSIVISGIGTAEAGRPEMFQWWSDRPVALVIIRSNVDGDDVRFATGPVRWGTAVRQPGDGGGIRYIAFCYDTEPVATPTRASADRTPAPSLLARLLRSPSPA